MGSANNVVLIGMPGAGKSTLGVVLAKILGKDFLDCDLVIQQTYGHTLHQMIQEQGTEGFLQAEQEVLLTINANNCIIATGGSAVYSAQAMEHLAHLGPVVYLSISCDSLLARLEDLNERGVVMKSGSSTDLVDLYHERLPLYERYATLTVDVDGLSITEAARKVSAALSTV